MVLSRKVSQLIQGKQVTAYGVYLIEHVSKDICYSRDSGETIFLLKQFNQRYSVIKMLHIFLFFGYIFNNLPFISSLPMELVIYILTSASYLTDQINQK